jgi:hypothetical protein
MGIELTTHGQRLKLYNLTVENVAGALDRLMSDGNGFVRKAIADNLALLRATLLFRPVDQRSRACCSRITPNCWPRVFPMICRTGPKR